MNKFFGKRLKELRKETEKTQGELAKMLNVSKTTICQWETHKQEASMEDIVKICLLFNVSADYLLGLEDDFGNKITPGKYTIQDSFNNNSGKIDIR